MTATTRALPGRYGFAQVASMEWVKLRSLRSTWAALMITVVGAVAVAVAVGTNTPDGSGDLTNNVLAGIIPGLLVTGVMGVLVMTSEYSSGMIGVTLAAIPNRPLVMVAKIAVFGSIALLVGEVAAFIAFFAGGWALPDTMSAPSLGQPGVLRAVVLSGTAFCLIGLMGLGVGTVIRHTAAAVAVLVGGVFLGAQFVAAFAHQVLPYLPIGIVANALAAVKQPWAGLSPWVGLGTLGLYAAGVLVLGTWLLARRDA